MKRALFFIIITFLFSGCTYNSTVNSPKWADSTSWFRSSLVINEDFVDVFYITSTCIISSDIEDGEESFQSVLSESDIQKLEKENRFVAMNIFSDSINFFAPYYAQYTMNSIFLPKEKWDSILSNVRNEIYDSFDYYIRNMNNGRRFILAGFSQGAQHVKYILKHMDNDTYSKMVAAYVIGFGVNEDDLKCPRIIPAKGESDLGVTISFNTVKDTSAIWDFVYDNSKTCTNPINWKTDGTINEFEYRGRIFHAGIDTSRHVLVVPDFDIDEDLGFDVPWPKNNLHHYDILFYSRRLHDNALLRAYGTREQTN